MSVILSSIKTKKEIEFIRASCIEKTGKSKEEHMQCNHVLDNGVDALFETRRASWQEAASGKRNDSGAPGYKSQEVLKLATE